MHRNPVKLKPPGGHRDRTETGVSVQPTHAIREQQMISALLGAAFQIRDDLRTWGGAVHGGTLMAVADTIGAVATALNLPPQAGTTTLESKTNFFAAGRTGKLRVESTPLHRGKRTHVWQTRVTDESGRLLSLTIQTQMVLAP